MKESTTFEWYKQTFIQIECYIKIYLYERTYIYVYKYIYIYVHMYVCFTTYDAMEIVFNFPLDMLSGLQI